MEQYRSSEGEGNSKCKGQLPTAPQRLQFSEAGSSVQLSPDLVQHAGAEVGGNEQE